jgi:hypothetical protein
MLIFLRWASQLFLLVMPFNILCANSNMVMRKFANAYFQSVQR